jgi:hypothetical protein
MRHLPSELRRATAALCVFVLACGAVAGCKGGTATPSATAAPTTYKNATSLASNLASLGHVSGPVNGTMKVGSDSRTLSGTATLDGQNSQISLEESGQDKPLADEIVMAGHRYTSPDDKTWIDRGTKAAGSGLAAVLAGADTSMDAGVGTVGGVTAHKILTAPDKVDVAPALGIDTWTFDDESTTLRVWADDAGKPRGFGATMTWKVTLGGTQEDVSADLDVMFTYTSPADIKAPNSPWQWIEDKTTGVAFGLPSGWSKNAASSSKNTVYADAATGNVLVYASFSPGTETLDQNTSDLLKSVTDPTTSPQPGSIASESASRFTDDSTKSGVYQDVGVALHENLGYIVSIGGPRTSKPAVDSLADQILSTVEFTR